MMELFDQEGLESESEKTVIAVFELEACGTLQLE